MYKNVDIIFVENEGLEGKDRQIAEKYNGAIVTKMRMNGDQFIVEFEQGGLSISDDAQSCCESRYMHTEDESDFEYHVGATFRFIQIVDGPDGEGSECHETKFCNVLTSKGVIQLVCHNEHNGYYGGFGINLREV